jgi:type V secretory pathway adhesin AidA
MVSNHRGWTERRVRSLVGVVALGAFAGCSDSIGVGDASSFTADVTGTTSARLTGTAAASGDWSREAVIQATLPNGAGTITSIALTASGGNVISFTRQGTSISPGTYRIGFASAPNVSPVTFSSGYVVRRTNDLQLFPADSGSLTITESGSRVTGTFTIYANKYIVIPIPRREDVGKPITPSSSGTERVTISGAFEAVRR